VLATSLLAFAASCTTKKEATDKVGVAVTILPQVDFMEQIGGEKVAITVMVPSGASPHTYEPTPSQMSDLSKAKMYAKVGSGVEFELVWMDKLINVNKKILVIDCSQGIELQETSGENEHEHEAMDPHIWMSPLNAKIMVHNICDGLVQVDPPNRAYYEQNRDDYLQNLTKLDQDMRNSLSSITKRIFMVYHPTLSYFARDYNLTMLLIEEEGKEPTAADIARLIKQAKEYNIKVIFASLQFNPESARVIAEAIGGKVVFIDSLAGEYIVNLRLLLDELVQAME
jgi:zinc transport system substrate-binding protein